MNASVRRYCLLAAIAAAALLSPSTAEGAAPAWQAAQPPPPAGAQFPASLGPVGDIQFFAPNRGLMITAGSGSTAFPKGLLYWNGASWRQLSTVCGGPADSSRIAWAGPSEFWTISDPALTAGSGALVTTARTLCHFRNGAVVASYGVPDSSADPFRRVQAATCFGPDECWFGGVGSQTPDGTRQGSFHLHWDGATLSTQYLRHGTGTRGGRAVTDLEEHNGTVFESTAVGGALSGSGDTVPHASEPVPHLLHRIGGLQALPEPWFPAASSAPANGGTEVDGLDSDGQQLWAIGNAARSGINFDSGAPFERKPLAARLGEDGMFHEIAFASDPFTVTDRFVDVAAVPGSDSAWVAIQTEGATAGDSYARVALLHADGSVTDVQSLPASGPPRGPASRIACPAKDDCWMVTSLGWLFRLTDGTQPPVDTDPAFDHLIAARPADDLTPQSQPDSIPEDDSLRFQQPPDPEEPPQEQQQAKTKRVKAAVRKVRTRLKGRRKLVVSFTLARKVRVSVVAKRGRQVIAKTKLEVMKRGRHSVELPLDPQRPPTGLRFVTREIGKSKDEPAQSPDEVSTGAASATDRGTR